MLLSSIQNLRIYEKGISIPRLKITVGRSELVSCLTKCLFYCTCGPGSKCCLTKMLCLRLWMELLLFYLNLYSTTKAFYFKASSTYFLLGPGKEHLFLRCFLSPNGKERTDCIPLRFGPSLQKRRLLVLHSEKGSCDFLSLPGSHNMLVSVVLHELVV